MCLHTTGSEHCAGLKYLGLNISQSNLKIMIEEENDNKYFRRPIRLGLLDKQDQI